MCQKAVGNLFAALVGTIKSDLSWTRGEPASFRSSAHVERGFCAACGTPLFYRSDESEHMSLTIGSLDRPLDVMPAWQVGTEARADWVTHIGDLDSQGATEDGEPEETDRIHRSNRQHPDHDTERWPPAAGPSP
jgi:hypothetical protein